MGFASLLFILGLSKAAGTRRCTEIHNMWSYSSTTLCRPAEGEIYCTDVACLCNEMKRVCKVDYSSHRILVELQALLLVYWSRLERQNERTAYYSR
jgi:hypothetical protein